jgi:hypothetical protein
MALKWDARIKLDQVQKYLLLHADLDATEGLKRPFLLFLTRDGFRACWRPRGEFGEELPVADFLRVQVAASQGPTNIPARLRQVAADRYLAVAREVTYGFTVWREFARQLERMLDRLEEEGGRQVEGAVIGGFLRDLAQLQARPSDRGEWLGPGQRPRCAGRHQGDRRLGPDAQGARPGGLGQAFHLPVPAYRRGHPGETRAGVLH